MDTLYGQIVSDIMHNINENKWPVGYVIPTEKDFQEQYGVSRATVRNAVLKLVNLGYLVRKKGCGTYVTRPKIMEQSSLFIESFAEEMASKGKEVKTEVLEFRTIESDEDIASHLEISTRNEVIKLTRLRYGKDSFSDGPIVLTTSYFPKTLEFITRYNLEQMSMHEVLAMNGILRKSICKEITVEFLSVKEARLLGMTEGAPAIVIISVVRNQNNGIVEYSKSCYPVPRNRFVLKINS